MRSAGTTIDSILHPYRKNSKVKTFVLINDATYKLGAKVKPWHLKTLGSIHYFNRKHIDLISLERFTNDKWTFGIVRNPWDRTVSTWKWFCKSSKQNRSLEWFIKIKPQNLSNNAVRIKIGYLKQTQFDLLTDKNNDISYLDHVGKFENLSEEIKIIRKKVGAPIEDPIPFLNSTTHKHYTEYYNDELINRIGEQYKMDINTFNYDFK